LWTSAVFCGSVTAIWEREKHGITWVENEHIVDQSGKKTPGKPRKLRIRGQFELKGGRLVNLGRERQEPWTSREVAHVHGGLYAKKIKKIKQRKITVPSRKWKKPW